ncbi:RNA polymerase sigma-70 factor, ECF subfamily [Pedobacter westerhofensis]|uniref:RNA polymerase sigma-70 factor, ECF subfamily n=1 Tax=Pedobacter westerhofensis TaxID=425512 RepID=A0A521CSV5_9SPHI|nr:RNA polymerase sigma-70 factor [Pedobacter westerhofensis]SMO62506.1 RNA polymerase sigma-70 factor, ECF subfamily [Pedobacter westerhofensis]
MTAYNCLSDLELLDLVKSDNESAFAEIYERYFGVLYLHAYHRLHDQDEAKDLIQELFTYLWSTRRVLEPKTNFSNYLYTWVRNRVLNVIAHKQVQEKYLSTLPPLDSSVESLTDHRLRERQLAAIIEREVALLPPKMREVFMMSRKANLSYKDIGAQLNLSEQTVRSHVKNALKILKARLGILFYLFIIFYK